MTLLFILRFTIVDEERGAAEVGQAPAERSGEGALATANAD